jgi:aminoglycoside phosphotransferase (APT) family kinase protein
VPDHVRARALERLEALPDGDRLLHGDFHPANLLRTDEGCVVIDWTSGTSGDPAADVARTVLLAGGGTLPDDASALIRAIAPSLRRFLVRGYLRAYAGAAPLDRESVQRWLPVWAAARLAEGIEEEREALLARATSSRSRPRPRRRRRRSASP